jgi:hypothetical protein
VVLEIDVGWVHHHLHLVELLLELHHLILPLDQSPVHDRHHELDFHLNELENLMVLLLLMMMDLDFLCHPEHELEPHETSLHQSPF